MTQARARAKINLTLEILGKRGDGYHELATVFQAVELSDSISFNWEADSASLACDHPEIPADETNLALKAVRIVEEFLGRPVGVSIHLEKTIPAGAGLGGGSSDAAAVLEALSARFEIPGKKVLEMGARLGADVPFFLTGKKTALGGGVGEKLEPLPELPSYPVVIVKPPFPISTSFAYGRIREYSSGEKSGKLAASLKSGKPDGIFEHLTNDFEKALFPEYPILKKIKGTFLDFGVLAAQLSGSGSAIFAFASDNDQAEGAARAVEPYGKVWVTRT